MFRFKKRLTAISIWVSAALVMTLIPSVGLAAEEEGVTGSYSRGPLYEFDEERTAQQQLSDLFTTIDLMDASISDLQREMDAGHLCSEKLTQMYLDRIAAYDQSEDLNSVIWINKDALLEAKSLDQERAAGKVRGKLHGIPVIVKDNYNVKGMPTAAGSVALADLIAKEDSEAVRRLREAGAVIIGKANMSEFAYSAVDSESTLGGNVHNAYDAGRSSAGSSGGTATAVRSCFAAAGLGTDTGGSIRNPSSWSNLFGIRPSKGLTSISGIIPLIASRDTSGPMAKTAEDLSIVLEAMAGEDENDDYTLEAGADDLVDGGYLEDDPDTSLKGVKRGFLRSSFDYCGLSANELNPLVSQYFPEDDEPYTQEYLLEEVPPKELPSEVDALARRARADLRKAGAEFVDLSGYFSDEEIFCWSYLNYADSMEYDVNRFLSGHTEYSGIKTLKDILKTGSDIGYIKEYLGADYEVPDLSDKYEENDFQKYGYIEYSDEKWLRPEDWSKVLEIRDRVSGILEDNDVDAIMYMYLESPAFINNGDIKDYNQSKYERAFGPALGLPDLNVPLGFVHPGDGDTKEKLPLGMGLVGRYGGEKELLQIAYAYEKQADQAIKKAPGITPALRDEELNSYLDALMEQACRVESDSFNGPDSSKIRKLNDAYNKALDADYSDPFSVYSAAYELAVSYDRLFEGSNEKQENPGIVLVKGQKMTDIKSTVFNGSGDITALASEDKKIISVSKRDAIKAKRPGKTVIRALNTGDKKNPMTISSCTVTVVDRPKIRFGGTFTSQDAEKMIDPSVFLIFDGNDYAAPDHWSSSNTGVAEIDSKTGMITIRGKGKTRITAYFGNVKIKGTLKIDR